MADWLEFWEKLYGSGRYEWGEYNETYGLSSVDGTLDTDGNGKYEIDCSNILYQTLKYSGFDVKYFTTKKLG